ncbi:MAG: class I SAM-dependent methyltransferase [Anaerolineae bacterium]|nr:class I SAM-dependent methyltransferase [Anaerolineae bacterium]
MEPDHRSIYANEAARYDRMVLAEDYQNHILPAIDEIRPIYNTDIVESGAGTGRLTTMLAPLARSIRAYDASAHMLERCTRKLRQMDDIIWETAVAIHDNLPCPDNCADIAISGWSVCYAMLDGGAAGLEAALAELQRVLRPNGTLILLETLGTGFEQPTAPEPLQPYFAELQRHGFQSTWIRTDYRFASVEEAEELTRFFFGDELGDRVSAEKLTILPECTGIWWQHLHAPD